MLSTRAAACFLLLLLLVSNVVAAYTIPPLGLGALLFQPSAKIQIEPSLGRDAELLEAADFFTDAFWTAKIGGGAKQLTDGQRKSLYQSQLLEFKRRYGSKKPLADKRAELLLCKSKRQVRKNTSSNSSSKFSAKTGGRRSTTSTTTSASQQLLGVAAVEVESIPQAVSSSLSFSNSQLPSNNGYIRAPLMSNVAVSKQWRRRGIAELLVKDVEDLVFTKWGYSDYIYLYVEERNKPAIRLYQKLGYKRYWSNNAAKTLLPNANGGMTNEPTTLVCMRKRLKTNKGAFGRLKLFG